MENILIIVRGLPGSGKSTLAKKLAQRQRLEGSLTVNLEADQYMIQNGEYVFDREKLHGAHKWCQESTRIFLNNGYDVIVSNTFTTLKEIEPYQKIAADIGIKMVVVKVTGDYGSIHDVPSETLEKMKARWQDFDGEAEI